MLDPQIGAHGYGTVHFGGQLEHEIAYAEPKLSDFDVTVSLFNVQSDRAISVRLSLDEERFEDHVAASHCFKHNMADKAELLCRVDEASRSSSGGAARVEKARRALKVWLRLEMTH